MKKFASAICCVLLLAACSKYIDWDDVWHKHNPNCRIEKINYYPEFRDDTTTATFSYNAKGNPTSIMLSQASTGQPHHLFRYDNKGRLTDLIAPYLHNQSYEYWVQYKYDNKGRVISDTKHSFGTYINGQPLPSTFLITTSTYEYDAWERIVKTVTQYPEYADSLVIIDTYEYNIQGNLTRHQNKLPAGVIYEEVFNNYDDKVSMWRTNKLWMFIDRNYSKNNGRPVVSYNAKALPTKYDLGSSESFQFIHSLYMAKSDVVYSCK